MISGFRREVDEICTLLSRYAAQTGILNFIIIVTAKLYSPAEANSYFGVSETHDFI